MVKSFCFREEIGHLVMNLPNSLTLSRIFLVPLLLVVLLTGDFPNREFWGLVVFLSAAATDYFDGYIARRRQQVTNFGKLFDPLADKLLISSCLIALVQLEAAPAWIVVLIVGREFAVTGLRSIAATSGITVSASNMGKLKMVSQVACCGFLIVANPHPEGIMFRIGNLLLWVTAVISILSMVQYFKVFWGRIGQASNQ
jgi:CDP-diacylglycerol--glycerol-3-phosphate 3-phosphatidyltransferase